MAPSDNSSSESESKRPSDPRPAGGLPEPVSQALTMVFTDLQGSTSLKEEIGDDRASTLINRHCGLVLTICEDEQGRVVNNPGDGFFLTFPKPSQAVRFALKIQYAHAADKELPGVRIGIHHGEVNVSDGLGGFLGIEVDTAARVQQMASPGQILASSSAFKSAKARVREIDDGIPVKWKWYGEYHLKGVEDPVALGEVGFEGISPFTPPARLQPSVTETALGEAGKFVPSRDGNPLIKHPGQLDISRRSNVGWLLLVGGVILLAGAGLGAGYYAGLYQADDRYRPEIELLSGQLEEAHDRVKELESSVPPAELTSYLKGLIAERTGDWGGKFEQLYTTGTVFMLTPKGTRSKLMGVYGRLIRWRLDIDKLDQKDKVLLSLTGYANEAEPLGKNESFGEYINSRIDRVLFDKDLINCDLELETAPIKQKGLLILGEPAAGKSTLLKFLELESARWALGDPLALVPVRIELGELETGTHAELLARIENRGSGKLALPASQKYLLLIDALDEAPSTQTAANACIELAKDQRVGRIIVTSRIINYDVLVRGSNADLAEHGFRTCLYYGQSPAAVEKRILTVRQSDQRQSLLDLLSDSEKRPVWQQFFRLPANFDFASDFLLDADLSTLESPNRILLLESYLGNLMKKRDWPGERPTQAEVDEMLSKIAGVVFQTPTRSSFANLQVREAMQQGSVGEIHDEEWKKIENLLAFANKVGIIEDIKDGFRFRHVQFLEYYAAKSNLKWDAVDPLDVNWREVLLFKSAIGDEDARALVKRMIPLAKQPASGPPNDYLIQLAIQCIDSGPLRDDPEFTALRQELTGLATARSRSKQSGTDIPVCADQQHRQECLCHARNRAAHAVSGRRPLTACAALCEPVGTSSGYNGGGRSIEGDSTMPMHDWTRVEPGIFHAFHHEWISEISRALNQGLLPDAYYALPEQVAAGFGPDVLTLQEEPADVNPETENAGGPQATSVLQTRPRTTFTAETDAEFYRRKKSSIAIRHISGDHIVAMLEIVSPGNKSNRHAFRALVEKACELLEHRIHLLIVDPFPPSRRDPNGIHAAIWEQVQEDPFRLADDQPLTLAAYECGVTTKAFIETVGVGQPLPNMPLFLEPDGCVMVPLEATYQAAFSTLPKRWRNVLAPCDPS